MNTYKKMYRSNAQAKEWLKDNGYSEIHMFPHSRFSKDLNFKGLKFDGIAISEDKLCLFQIKSNGKPTKKYQEFMKEFSEHYGIICLWFNVRDRRMIEVIK